MNERILVILMGLIIIVSVFFLYKNQRGAHQTHPIKPISSSAIKPNDSHVSVSNECLTSKATGANNKKAFPVSHLVSNGKTDDQNAIQEAINNAGNAGGGMVKLPAGTFLINSPLIMKDNVTLEGVGSATILKAGPKLLTTDPTIGYSIVTTNGASNVTIANFTADQQGNILDGNSIDRFFGYVIHAFNSKNVIVENVFVRNPFAYSIVAENSTQFCFKNNNTQVSTSGKYDQLDGIHVLNSSFGDVLNNYVDQGYAADGDDGLVAHTIAGSVHDITYAGNVVRGGKGGSGMQLALTNTTDTIYNIKIQNNEFWGSPRGIRTGYYGGTGGSVHDILIGGSAKTGNFIHDNTFNDTKTGDAINIYGNGIDPYNISVSYNKACKAGTISVGTGKNNTVAFNTRC